MAKSAYIHIPFCKNICSYCDFCKLLYNKKWIDKYINSLSNEIISEYKKEVLDTLYIGGGTPSSLDISELNNLFDILKIFKLSKNYEFTFEINVDDINEEKLLLLKKNRVNRLSIGVETFNDIFLKYLGRNYKSNDITDKINLAKKYFDNISIDLIYGMNNQTLKDLEDDLNQILKLDVTHVSCYSLIIEKNTKLYLNNTKYISDELDSNMYNLINSKLKEKYNRYEVSNYAKKDFESKHNMAYWNNEEYYGFGLGASSYIKNKRYTNTKNLGKYMNNNYDRKIENIDKESKIIYELILGFRKTNGINKSDFYKKYSIDIYSIDNICDLLNKKLIIDDGNNIYVEEEYFYVLNDILVNFV